MSRSRAKTPSQRQLRVGEEIRHALARVFARGGFADPKLSDAAITVTEVRISPDLKNATAFVVPLGGAEMAPLVAALNHAAGFIRGRLSQELTLRYLPRMTFEADETFDRAGRLREILDMPRVRQDLEQRSEEAAPAPGEGGPTEDDEDHGS